MNFALMISTKVEEKLDLVDRGVEWSQADEGREYERCLKEVLEENEKAWADGNIRVGDYILLGELSKLDNIILVHPWLIAVQLIQIPVFQQTVFSKLRVRWSAHLRWVSCNTPLVLCKLCTTTLKTELPFLQILSTQLFVILLQMVMLHLSLATTLSCDGRRSSLLLTLTKMAMRSTGPNPMCLKILICLYVFKLMVTSFGLLLMQVRDSKKGSLSRYMMSLPGGRSMRMAAMNCYFTHYVTGPSVGLSLPSSDNSYLATSVLQVRSP